MLNPVVLLFPSVTLAMTSMLSTQSDSFKIIAHGIVEERFQFFNKINKKLVRNLKPK